MKSDSNDETMATLMFDRVIVKDSNSKTSKDFQEVPIEVAGKEIYVGSNYKVKWKHITSLRCKNDVNEMDEEEEGGSDSPRALQEYRDSDYETAGFNLVCVMEAKKKSKHNHGMDNSNHQQQIERTFSVCFPIAPEGQRRVAIFWEAFRKALEGGYKKQVRKRQKKQDKERAQLEEELHEQEVRRKEFSKSRSRRTTYSKRPYDFMRKNAANIAHNAEVWSDDEEEEGVPIHRERTPELVAEDKEAEEEAAPIGSEDESEHEFNDFGATSTFGDEDHVSGVEDAKDSGEDDADKSSHKEPIDEEEDDDSVTNVMATKSLLSKKRRIKRRGPVFDESEDEDDNLFHTNSNTAEMMAPGRTAERVVTPATVKATIKETREEDGKGKNLNDGLSEADETDEEESAQNNKKINSFFQPRSKTITTTKDKNATNSTAEGDGDVNESAAAKMDSESEELEKDDESEPKESDSVTPKSFFAPRSKTAAIVRQKTKTPMRVFTPKKKKRTPTTTKNVLDNNNSDSDETSTIVAESSALEMKDETANANSPSRSPFFRAHSPKQRKTQFEIVRGSESKTHDGRTRIEEEDPIEEIYSSQSQSPTKRRSSSFAKRSRLSSGRLASSIKRRRLKTSQSKTALEALEFADTRAQHLRSPISRKVAINTAMVPTTGGRSPLQPLKLGPQVEMAASGVYDNNIIINKWRGLRNDGNSCYVNSSLQQLFSVPKFMRAMKSFQDGHELTTKLLDLYENLNASDTRVAASAKPVKKVVDRLTSRFHGYQQRDAHEFLGEVMDQIHEELSPNNGKDNESETKDGENKSPEGEKNDSKTNVDESKGSARKVEPTDEFFRWNVQVCLKCKSCGYSR